MAKSKVKKSTLTQEECEVVMDIVCDAMNNMGDTLLIGINIIVANRFKGDKIEQAMKIATKLIN